MVKVLGGSWEGGIGEGAWHELRDDLCWLKDLLIAGRTSGSFIGYRRAATVGDCHLLSFDLRVNGCHTLRADGVPC